MERNINSIEVELSKSELDNVEIDISEPSAWEIVQISRHPKRPILQDYLSLIFDNFVELHGDRYFSDDNAIIGGFAEIGGQKIMLIGHNKGKSTVENI